MHAILWRGFLSGGLFLAISLAVFIPSSTVFAREEHRVVIEVLERADCTHCLDEKLFLDDLTRKRTDIEVRYRDIADADNAELFRQVTQKAGMSQSTPVTIVGLRVMQGFDTAETTGKRIERFIDDYRKVAAIENEDETEKNAEGGFDAYLRADAATLAQAEQGGASCASGEICAVEKPALLVNIPLIGTKDAAEYSLIALASVLGFLDGFNPCAMWVLVTFLLVLMQIGSKKKMLAIAGLFIVAEAAMYYLILNVWFKTWNFIGLDRIVTPVIGVLAVLGGMFFLYEWFKSLKTEMACQIIDAENRSKIVRKIKSFSEGPLTIAAVMGIVGLAFSVNVIEFACSIGYPQAFTKIIQLNDMAWWQTQGYMALYILFYMIDDCIVFGLALWGFDKMHVTQGFSKWSALVGGVCMLLLGYLLIFAPGALKSLG
jgi:hypothetical protein